MIVLLKKHVEVVGRDIINEYLELENIGHVFIFMDMSVGAIADYLSELPEDRVEQELGYYGTFRFLTFEGIYYLIMDI